MGTNICLEPQRIGGKYTVQYIGTAVCTFSLDPNNTHKLATCRGYTRSRYTIANAVRLLGGAQDHKDEGRCVFRDVAHGCLHVYVTYVT